MKTRVFAEQMEGSLLWQVVQQNPIDNERFIVKKDMSKEEAHEFAVRMQAAINKAGDE